MRTYHHPGKRAGGHREEQHRQYTGREIRSPLTQDIGTFPRDEHNQRAGGNAAKAGEASTAEAVLGEFDLTGAVFGFGYRGGEIRPGSDQILAMRFGGNYRTVIAQQKRADPAVGDQGIEEIRKDADRHLGGNHAQRIVATHQRPAYHYRPATGRAAPLRAADKEFRQHCAGPVRREKRLVGIVAAARRGGARGVHQRALSIDDQNIPQDQCLIVELAQQSFHRAAASGVDGNKAARVRSTPSNVASISKIERLLPTSAEREIRSSVVWASLTA